MTANTSTYYLRVFKRVLPLPNGNWNTVVDDWCCHPDPFANKKLLPRQEDCLLGDTFFLLNRDDGCKETLTHDTNYSSDLRSEKVRESSSLLNVCQSELPCM